MGKSVTLLAACAALLTACGSSGIKTVYKTTPPTAATRSETPPSERTLKTTSGSETTPAKPSSSSNLTVVRCPTTFGVSGAEKQVPPELAVQTETPTQGLAAYTNTEDYLLAPHGMQCAGQIAADGGAQVKVWPMGGAEPAMHSASEGLTLFLEPACASCKAGNACPFFTSFAQEQGFPCRSAVPAGEQTSEPHSHLVLFTDPPGVAGSGWPSGGEYPANGLVGITSSGEVYRSTCTLPSSEHSRCTTSLNYVITRYSTGRSVKETPKPESKEEPPKNEPKQEEREDEVGSSSHAGDAKFCSEHTCIGSFTTESGTVVECSDETFSHAGGIQGACSHHGGVKRE